jgi:hypothetical protein
MRVDAREGQDNDSPIGSEDDVNFFASLRSCH